MKRTAPVLLIVFVLLLAACGSNDAQPTATSVSVADPTEAPTAVPTEEAAVDAEGSAEAEPTAEAAEAGDTTTNIPDEQLELMAAVAPPPQLSEREPGIETAPCFPGIRLGGVEGVDYTCGVFTVPQNWDEPDGRNLDLAFVVVKATGENPEPDPLLHLTGGPGPSAILAIDVTKFQKLRPARDVIFYDIRGTGFSQRLGLQECLVLALQNGAPAEQIEALQVAAPDLVGAASGDEILAPPAAWDLDHPALNGICAEQFAAQGLDLNHFSTANNARDAVELIKALGYESFNIQGESYGTRQAMTIMDDIPGYNDVPALRSVVLDSTFPPSVYLIRTMVRSDHDFMLQLLSECEADAACNEAYPNLTGRLAALLDKLEEEPLTASGETVTLDDLVQQLQPGVTRAGYVPKMIAELEMGVLDTYLALRDEQIGTAPAEPVPPFEWDTSDPVQAFLAGASALIDDEGAAGEFIAYASFGLLQEDPLAALQALIEEGYPGETGDQMLELLGTLTKEDIASSPYVAQLPSIEIPGEGESDPESQLAEVRERIARQLAELAYTTIHCIDDILHESLEDASTIYNNLQFPQLTDLEETQVQAGRCENWPVNAAPIEVKGPVTSNVPALILQGAYDQPTPVYMGQTAARELENSTYILIPQQGHGTWTNAGNCVGQIATAFVQDPEAELDLSCLDARQPQWVLPGDGESATGQLVAEQMMNATYGGIYEAPVTLIDGIYEGEPFVEGGASRPVVTFVDNTLVYGDLDGDGLDDAVALLIENSGGSGTFSYVGAQLNRDGQPIDAGAALLGDRVQLISMRVEDGQVVAEIVTQGPDEGLCCGTLKMRKTLGFQDGQLVEVASEELGTVSLNDLMGTQWLLHRLNYDQEPLVDVTVSAEFAEGTVSGTGGCNSYSADVTSDGGQLLAVAPIATTLMACDDELEALEAEYLAALQSATEWRFYPGLLAISYVAAGGEQGTLFFEPATIK